jgi:hypothetical protein
MRRDNHLSCNIVHTVLWSDITVQVTFSLKRLGGLSEYAFNLKEMNGFAIDFLFVPEMGEKVHRILYNNFVESHQFDTLKKLTFPNEQA